MSEPQSLEEAWRNHGLALTSEELDNTARALAQAVLEEAANEEGNPFPLEGEGYAKLQRRIKALGR